MQGKETHEKTLQPVYYSDSVITESELHLTWKGRNQRVHPRLSVKRTHTGSESCVYT